jgi:hypothetical protein
MNKLLLQYSSNGKGTETTTGYESAWQKSMYYKYILYDSNNHQEIIMSTMVVACF